ncbi:MAG: hypothetical protein H6612_12390 [Ignavibacteriales bacterium]|nr:hypothetical protein [Ignavibacteriales bacterium]MCB9260139.1 hypothetical protein [Ignavibacteriales bacterium]
MELTLKIIFYLIFAPFVIFPQIKIHKHLTTDDGLVQGQISCMFQDSKGYIWFGTYDGVSKWDGINFENIQTHNGLLSSAVIDIKEGYDGKIYIGCYQGGVLIYDNSKLDTLNNSNGLLSNAVTSIYVLKNNDIIISSAGGNINKLKNDKVSDWGIEIGYPKGPNYGVRDIFENSKGEIFFASQSGLFVLKNGSLKNYTTNDGLNHNLLIGIGGNNKGTVYINSYKGIHKFINGKITNLINLATHKNIFAFRMHISNDGTFYSATANGIIVEKNNQIEIISEKNGLAFNNCWSVLEDKNGIIYFGTNGNGVSIYNPNESIVNYNKSTGLPNESIWSILKAKDGTFYFGSENGLIISKDNKYKVLNSKNGLIGNFIRVLKESKKGEILVGSKSGFSIINNGDIINFNLDNDIDISQVYAIEETNLGEIILGTQNGIILLRNGKVQIDESNKITEKLGEGLGGKSIFSISNGKDGSLIFGSLYGLAIYKNNEFTFYTAENGLSDNLVNTTHVRKNGTILVGTLKGLNILSNGIVTDTIDVNDGLSNNSIADISEDSNGRIFVSTYNGLNILNGIKDSITIRQLHKKDGLIGNDITHEGTFVDDEDNLWIGTLFGITKYNPNRDKPITAPPKIYISAIELFNEEYSLDKFASGANLNYDENFLRFNYTGINLSAPEKIKYKFRLSGLDNNWIETQETFSNYTNLDDGNYTFEVKAGNEWGYWSEPASLSFVISPAWWETWWFYLLSTASIILFIAFLVSYRYRNLLAVEKIRTKISTDLHDSIGAGLSEINILSELLNSNPNNKIEDYKKGVSNISVTARSLVGNMSDIVWLVNPSKDSLKDLLLRLPESYFEIFNQADISFEIKNIDKLNDIRLPMEFRQHLFLIFKEAINNSLKYSNCSNLVLEVIQNGRNFIIKLVDDGIGFDLSNHKSGNGLLNMKERAEKIGGNLQIDSEINEGTTIQFSGNI